MAELDKILTNVAKAIADHPDAVAVEKSEDGDNVLLVLSVDADDMGRIIGRHGRIARAIRMVMKAAANNIGKKVTVEIR